MEHGERSNEGRMEEEQRTTAEFDENDRQNCVDAVVMCDSVMKTHSVPFRKSPSQKPSEHSVKLDLTHSLHQFPPNFDTTHSTSLFLLYFHPFFFISCLPSLSNPSFSV